MINTLMIVLCCFLIVYVVIRTITINKRLIVYTDIIEKYESGRYGSSGSRSDLIELVDKKYDLYRRYYVIPTVLVIIERNKFKNHKGEKMSYFVDPKEVKSANKFKSPDYTAIAGEINGESRKSIWYWFSVVAYATKYGDFLSLVPIVGLVTIFVNIRSESHLEIIVHLFSIFCFFIWVFVL